VVITGNGGYERLDYCDVPILVPGPGEVVAWDQCTKGPDFDGAFAQYGLWSQKRLS
jgi:hypothetical protein